ncbi:myosin-11 [Halyomorpha halys]|uniref:myosin-11 n=1 Tax=Halyomorpha halys TaxID=286706 RepID=UPI0006D4E768|nr:uncharacterized protein LOC106685251 [Halyomorpha halys]
MARRNLGMKLLDDRWVLTDQLIQLKGVVEFNERNVKWLEVKEELYNRTYDSKIRHVSQNVKKLRKLIKSYEVGYVKEMDEVLKQDKEIYLICRQKSPDVIIENLKHMIFRQRKAVDKLNAEIKDTKQELFEVELNIAALKDKVNSGQEFVRDKDREENEKYSAALEYANTQNDVCGILLECYKKIIGVLKKDSLYFDDVIADLKNDAMIQSQTILKIIELGQLAVEDFSWLKQQAKRSTVKFNVHTNDHRKEIQESAEAIHTLELMKAKLNEYGAKAYPMFQEEKVQPYKDQEMEEMKEQLEESEKIFGNMKQILGVQTIADVFTEMESLRSTEFELDKLSEQLRDQRKNRQTTYEHTKTLAVHMDNYMPEEVKRFIKEEEAVREEIDMTAENIQKLKAAHDEIKQTMLSDLHFFLNMKRLLWMVEIGKPETVFDTLEDEENESIENTKDIKDKDGKDQNEDDPFGLFNNVDEPKSPGDTKGSQAENSTHRGDDSSQCETDTEDIPFRLMDLVSLKSKVLHDSIGDRGFEDECDPQIMEAFGDTLAEEMALREENYQKHFGREKIVVKKYKPRYEDHHSQGCEKKKRLELKFHSRQLIIENEIAKEKGEVRFHMHPQGVFRGMYIEEASDDESTEPEVTEKKEEAKKEDDDEDVPDEESDIGYEESEEDDVDSDLDPNDPKPHICY